MIEGYDLVPLLIAVPVRSEPVPPPVSKSYDHRVWVDHTRLRNYSNDYDSDCDCCISALMCGLYTASTAGSMTCGWLALTMAGHDLGLALETTSIVLTGLNVLGFCTAVSVTYLTKKNGGPGLKCVALCTAMTVASTIASGYYFFKN